MTSAHRAQSGAGALAPILLEANQPQQFYRGGSCIAELRGTGHGKELGPEDWVASTTARFGQSESGLSRLPDGRLLREAVSAEPELWLGAPHCDSFGDNTALLVKLLDAAQRLPVHCHPSDRFAQQHLGSHFGKTEAWVVIGTSDSNPVVYLGFREDVPPETVEHWVSTQDSSAMLGALNEIPVRVGDTVHVPAGTPHAIGTGVFLVELQQPTDFSVTLEWTGFLADAEKAFLGMEPQLAMETVNRRGFDSATISSLVKRTAQHDGPRVPLLAAQASEFFRAERLHPRGGVELEPTFGVLIVLDGAGKVRGQGGEALDVLRGDTVVVPHSAGAVQLEGEVVAVHCAPPRPRPA